MGVVAFVGGQEGGGDEIVRRDGESRRGVEIFDGSLFSRVISK